MIFRKPMRWWRVKFRVSLKDGSESAIFRDVQATDPDVAVLVARRYNEHWLVESVAPHPFMEKVRR